MAVKTEGGPAASRPKAKAGCRWDLVSLGEVMLRLDPGEGRIHTTRTFQVFEGGGEYNVARGLKRCFGLERANWRGHDGFARYVGASIVAANLVTLARHLMT